MRRPEAFFAFQDRCMRRFRHRNEASSTAEASEARLRPVRDHRRNALRGAAHLTAV